MSSGTHKGGMGEVMGGSDPDGNTILVSLGWGTREGETYLSSNTDQTVEQFRSDEPNNEHHGHDHYGSGHGPNDNGTRRDNYKGPGH